MTTNFSQDTADIQLNFNRQQINKAREQFLIQQRACKERPYPEEKLRKQQLKALKRAIINHQEKLLKAISADFGSRSFDESLLADILPTINHINYTLSNLRHWMRSEKRKISMLFQPAKGRIMYQPVGVVGIMAPWNYPVNLCFAPLIAALAAGNRAMLKPSEYSPYCNRVMNEIVQEAFTSDEVCLIEGDASVADQFSQLPFDHLLFTGSSAIGKKVMAAAAKNLTPVTLELGGKSPVLIAPDVTPEFAAERIIYGKCLNAGQTCVAPDYVLCPEDKVNDLVSALQSKFNQLYPDLGNGDYTSIINEQHFERIQSWLADAKQKGAEITSLAESNTQKPRQLPLQLITKVNSSMLLMQQEIFGPLLPIIPYNNIKQAIQTLNNHTRPLALYLFTHKQRLQDQILRHTHAGGVCINDTVSHVAQDDLPFGGIGSSGMGSYHGIEGFLTFSHKKALFKKGRFNSAKYAFPPYGKWLHRLIYKRYLK